MYTTRAWQVAMSVLLACLLSLHLSIYLSIYLSTTLPATRKSLGKLPPHHTINAIYELLPFVLRALRRTSWQAPMGESDENKLKRRNIYHFSDYNLNLWTFFDSRELYFAVVEIVHSDRRDKKAAKITIEPRVACWRF